MANIKDTYRDQDGILRWKSNDQVPPEDCLEEMGIADEDLTRCRAARDQEIAEFLAEYRRNYRGPSEEQLAEARAAHGPGVTLVNVITGHTYTT